MKKKFTPEQNIWFATILIIVGILAVAVASQRVIVKNTAEAFNRQQLFLARKAALGIERVVNDLETTLRTAADILAFYPNERIYETFFHNQQEHIQALFIINHNGEILYKYPPSFSAFPESGLDLQQAVRQAEERQRDVLLTDFMLLGDGNATNLTFVLGVSIAGTYQWICCIPNSNVIKEKYMYPIRSGETGYAWMIDSQGVLLAHPNKEMEGHKALDILKELWPEYSGFNLEAIIKREMAKGVEGKGEYTGWHLGEKQLTKKLIAFCPIHYKDKLWSVGISAPYHEVMMPLMDSLTGPFVFLTCFIIVIIVGAFLLIMGERRKQLVDQELRWSQEVFDSITDGISIIDRNYRVLMVNRSVCAWQGKPPDYFKGKPCYEVFQQQQETCVGCPAKETFMTGKPAFRERVSTTLGGKKYYFHLNTFPLKDEKGDTVKVAECVRDVTREMNLQAELIQHEQKSMIVKMSAQIAHEIRNPLGTLTLNIDLLEDEIDSYNDVDDAESKNLLATIRAELEGLHRVLNEYLECARFPTIRPEKHYINAILREMFSLMEEEFRRKKIVFKTSFEYDLPATEVDQDQIRRAFLNLVLNAVEAMEQGGTIEVTTRSVDTWIEIIFADTGVGIPDDRIDKIFTPFYTTKSGGTGLGLSISQHIITEHKGQITCESSPDAATRFIVRIPQSDRQQ